MGAAYGLAARSGLSGQEAGHTVFAVLHPLDVLSAMAIGVHRPSRWSRRDWAVDGVDEYVALQATGGAHDRLLAPGR